MSEENKAVLQRWFDEVWNGGRADVIDELLARDAVIHGLQDAAGQPVDGYERYLEFYGQFKGAFPNITVVVEDIVSEGDKVAARCSVVAKHTGAHLGIDATYSDVDFDGMTIVVVKDGKITEAWNNFDFMRMNKQLGLI